MSSSGGIEERDSGPLHAAVTGVLEMPLTPLSDDDVVEMMRDIEKCARILTAVQHRLLVEANERSLPARFGSKSIKKFLIETLRLNSADAGSRVHRALWVGTPHDMAGEPIDPPLPHTAHALESGEISTDHVRGIVAVMNRIPRGVGPEEREAAEQILAEFARTGSPDDIGKVGDRILAHLDPDGRMSTDLDRARRRAITIGRQRPDGMSPIHGEIDPVLRALLDPLLAKYARPGACNPDDPDSPAIDIDHADPRVLADAASRDRRSAAQRNHDALHALLSSGVFADRLGAHRGVPVTAILTMSVDEVEQAAGVATTATGGTVPMSKALALAERSQPFLAVFDHAGLPLHLGRTKRLASPAQRLALIATLHGCSRPGCDAPASLSAVHHVHEHRRGGATDIENLTLACDACHALIHDGPGGWKTVVQGPDSRYPGRTAWIAPVHVDPQQIPRLNHRHHANELLAEVLARIHRRNEDERAQHRRWLPTRTAGDAA
ncbi:HNH endonuclease signature motif containing protein [Nocardia sp. BMG51109]|uniref:HNH endonuclease signature motif containing protein n=1 Tax=Nocardia sp. BMG51109 TaxID=1056816 RepID=UPI0004657304|nr:HNH endonuclease signature motif containing protein [Nocardia sp. BMG51109]